MVLCYFPPPTVSVNHSLSSLTQVCEALVSNRPVPYNNSLLTILLRRFFSREQLFNIHMLLHLSPLADDYMDNKNLLGLGACLMKLHVESSLTVQAGQRFRSQAQTQQRSLR